MAEISIFSMFKSRVIEFLDGYYNALTFRRTLLMAESAVTDDDGKGSKSLRRFFPCFSVEFWATFDETPRLSLFLSSKVFNALALPFPLMTFDPRFPFKLISKSLALLLESSVTP